LDGWQAKHGGVGDMDRTLGNNIMRSQRYKQDLTADEVRVADFNVP
jgi:hypothetical protein